MLPWIKAKFFRLWLDPYSNGDNISLLQAPAERERAWTGVSPGQGALRAAHRWLASGQADMMTGSGVTQGSPREFPVDLE